MFNLLMTILIMHADQQVQPTTYAQSEELCVKLNELYQADIYYALTYTSELRNVDYCF